MAIISESLFDVLPCKYKVLSSNEQIFINNNFISLSLIFVRHKQPFGYISATLGLILANLAIVTASHDYDKAKMSWKKLRINKKSINFIADLKTTYGKLKLEREFQARQEI